MVQPVSSSSPRPDARRHVHRVRVGVPRQTSYSSVSQRKSGASCTARHVAGEGLRQVVVRVDQAGQHDLAARVDAAVGRDVRGRGAGAHRGDPVVLDQHVAVRQARRASSIGTTQPRVVDQRRSTSVAPARRPLLQEGAHAFLGVVRGQQLARGRGARSAPRASAERPARALPDGPARERQRGAALARSASTQPLALALEVVRHAVHQADAQRLGRRLCGAPSSTISAAARPTSRGSSTAADRREAAEVDLGLAERRRAAWRARRRRAASSQPPPRQRPSTAASVTWGSASSRRNTAWNASSIAGARSRVWSATSTPGGEGAGSAERSTTTFRSRRPASGRSRSRRSASSVAMSRTLSGGRAERHAERAGPLLDLDAPLTGP